MTDPCKVYFIWHSIVCLEAEKRQEESEGSGISSDWEWKDSWSSVSDWEWPESWSSMPSWFPESWFDDFEDKKQSKRNMVAKKAKSLEARAMKKAALKRHKEGKVLNIYVWWICV